MGPRTRRVNARNLSTTLALLLAAGGVIAASGTLEIATDRDTWRRLQAGDQAVPTGTDLTATAAAVAPAYRTYDGRGNNPLHPLWGIAGSNYRREDSGAAYTDGASMPPGAN